MTRPKNRLNLRVSAETEERLRAIAQLLGYVAKSGVMAGRGSVSALMTAIADGRLVIAEPCANAPITGGGVVTGRKDRAMGPDEVREWLRMRGDQYRESQSLYSAPLNSPWLSWRLRTAAAALGALLRAMTGMLHGG